MNYGQNETISVDETVFFHVQLCDA